MTAPIGLAHDGAQRETAHPIAAALVAEHIAPAARSRRVAVVIAAVRDRPGAGDDDNAGGGADPCLQRDQRVVDDENAGLVSDAAHDAADNGRVFRAVDPGDAEADGGGGPGLLRHRLFHHGVKDFLELQLADRLEVGAGASGCRQHAAFLVAEEANRLCAADVNAEDVHVSRF